MTIKSSPTRILSTCLLLALPLAACAQDAFDDPDQIGEAVNELNGGLDMEDEAPQFGDDALFDEADIVDEVLVTDVMNDSDEVVAMDLSPDAIRVHAAIRWGQIPFDRDAVGPVDWSGTLSVNRGALLVRRAVAFEEGDGVAPRDDIRSVSFRSRTLPASDGLRITIVDPNPQDPEPLRLDYSDANGLVHSIDIADLLGAPQSFDVDDRGNRIVAVALRDRRDDANCRSGFMRGRWHQVVRHGGRLLGRVRNAQGEPLGHMRGVYGQRDNGNKVFFGKYIGSDGAFRGIFAGRYEAGHFRGRWMSRSGDIGALGGRYRETIPGPEIGGHFLGRFASNSCNVDVGTDAALADSI